MAFRRRLLVLFLLAAAGMAAVALRVLQLQVLEGDRWRQEARAKRQRRLEIEAPRGRIVDRAGRVLARDVPIFQLALVGREWMTRGRTRCPDCGAIRPYDPSRPPSRRACPCGTPAARLQVLDPVDLSPLETDLGLPAGELARRAERRLAEVKALVASVRARREAEGKPEFLREDEERLLEEDLLLRPYVVVPRIPAEVVRRLELDEEGRFRGFRVRTDRRRDYPPDGVAGQMLGYVSVIRDWDELQRYRERYEDHATLDTRVGRAGLEKSYEDLLLGRLGWERRARDAEGDFTLPVAERPPEAGGEVRLALTVEACRVAEEAMARWATDTGYAPQALPSGGFVALDAENGEILVWGELPRLEVSTDLERLFAEADAGARFDPEVGQWVPPEGAELPGGEDLPAWRARLSKPAPLHLSRVSQIAVEPGSTFKLFVGVGLLDGLRRLPPGSLLPFERDFDCGARRGKPGCHAHRPVDFCSALEVSCNRYFAYSVRDLPRYWEVYRTGIPAVLERFGFGRRTGVDVAGETEGTLLRDWADFDPRAAASAAVARVREGRRLPEERLSLRVAPRTPALVAGRDPARFASLLDTLAGAALDAVGPGEVAVSLAPGGEGEDRARPLRVEVLAQPHPEGPLLRELDLERLRRAVRALGGTLEVDLRPPGILALGVTLAYEEPCGRRPGEPRRILPDDGRNVAIGQGPLAVTPLQMARAVAAIANAGRRVTPHAALSADGVALPVPEADAGFDPDDLERVREGMRAAVEGPEGTARQARWDLVPAEVYGKTGTAQVGGWWTPGPDTEEGPWHHWFAGFATAPGFRTIAFACVLHARREASAARTATNAVADFLAWWFTEGPEAR